VTITRLSRPAWIRPSEPAILRRGRPWRRRGAAGHALLEAAYGGPPSAAGCLSRRDALRGSVPPSTVECGGAAACPVSLWCGAS